MDVTKNVSEMLTVQIIMYLTILVWQEQITFLNGIVKNNDGPRLI